MVTKNRLEELIKNNARVYIKKDLNFNPCSLTADNGTNTYFDKVATYDNFDKECYLISYTCNRETGVAVGNTICKLEDIYEEKEAQWELENTAIVEDVLKFPQWQDIKFDARGRFVKRFHIKDDYDYFGELRVINIDDEHGTIVVQEVSAGSGGETFFDRGLTEENYKMACKICIKLFKGE